MYKPVYKERTYKKGSIIWIENSKAMPYFFILKVGQLKETIHMIPKNNIIIFKKGDTFGLIACLTGQKYISRLIADTDSLVVMIKKDDLIPFLSAQHNIFMKIVSDYSNRLREINHRLFLLCSNSMYSALPEHLIEIAEYFNKNKMYNHYYYALSKYVEASENEERKNEILNVMEHLKEEKKIEMYEREIHKSRLFYKAGEIIFLEQEKGEKFYFIEKGKVKISHFDENNEFIIAILNDGEFFGEMAILNRVSRNASAIAFHDTRLLILDKDTFINQLGKKILQNLITSLAKRIWYSYKRALNLSYKNPVTRLYDYLDFVLQSKGIQSDALCYSFDLTLTDLRVVTNCMGLDDSTILDFLEDDNISINYGYISIHNLEKFNDIVKLRQRLLKLTHSCSFILIHSLTTVST